MENSAYELKLELMERIEGLDIVEIAKLRATIREVYDIYLDYSEYHALKLLGLFAANSEKSRDIYNLIAGIAEIRRLNEILPETLNLLELAAVR